MTRQIFISLPVAAEIKEHQVETAAEALRAVLAEIDG